MKFDIGEYAFGVHGPPEPMLAVAAAKVALAKPCADPKQGVDVALATNMISVGLDIGRLGLMTSGSG